MQRFHVHDEPVQNNLQIFQMLVQLKYCFELKDTIFT
jgi:hypothetical protein